MTPTTKTTTEQKQCERCHVHESSNHPIGDFEVKLKRFSFAGEELLLCQRCLLRAEIKAKKSSTVDHSILFNLKQWWKGKKEIKGKGI